MIADSGIEARETEPVLERGVSVIVPVFNSESILPDLVVELSGVLGTLGGHFEILLVNDGSADGSWKEIQRLTEEYPEVQGINLSRNFGQHNAKLCGIRSARYDVSVTMDDDLQHPPSEIPKLLHTLGEGWDVVYGRPKKRQHSWSRNVLTRLTKTMVGRGTGRHPVMEQSPFRAFRTELRSAFSAYSGPDVLLDVLLGWGTTKFCSVPVAHHPRRRGTSTYTIHRLFAMGILALTAYSTAPLRFASWLGLVLTVFGILVFGYVLVVTFYYGSIPGFPFLASLICIFSGAQLFTLGLFGEYLTRIFNHALGRPTYVIKETTRAPVPSRASGVPFSYRRQH